MQGITEILMLQFSLGVSLVLAPVMTGHFFLDGSKAYSTAHKVTLAILAIGVILDESYVTGAWVLFCLFGLFLYLQKEHILLTSVDGLATYIPFLFSIISSVWFFAGSNDLYLLGYSRSWSYYASLHGSFLGWTFVGCLAYLSRSPDANRFYLWGCYSILVLFLLIAFGIDGVPYIKQIGVIGLSVLTPALIGFYALSLPSTNRTSVYLVVLSLFSILITMVLAVLNEFWAGFPRMTLGLPTMVLIHGLMNAVVTVPCFLLSVWISEPMSYRS